jgi:hypothetical protein
MTFTHHVLDRLTLVVDATHDTVTLAGVDDTEVSVGFGDLDALITSLTTVRAILVGE